MMASHGISTSKNLAKASPSAGPTVLTHGAADFARCHAQIAEILLAMVADDPSGCLLMKLAERLADRNRRDWRGQGGCFRRRFDLRGSWFFSWRFGNAQAAGR